MGKPTDNAPHPRARRGGLRRLSHRFRAAVGSRPGPPPAASGPHRADPTRPAFRLDASRGERGRFAVRLMRGREVLAAGEVNPHRPDQITDFVRRAYREVKGLRAALPRAELRKRLLALAAPAAGSDHAAEAGNPYARTAGGIFWHKPTARGPMPVRLTNFDARIVEEVVSDDGASRERAFGVEAVLAGRTHRFTVPASRFFGMTWAVENMGPAAVVESGARDRARVAIQHLSGPVPVRTVYAHTGWRDVGVGVGVAPVYLHAAGAIGANGPVPGIDVRLPGPLAGYSLPRPPRGDDLARCILASLRMLDVAPDRVTFPVYCAAFRAALGACDGSVFLTGPTGAKKSELSALGQQHCGPAMVRTRLPGNWSDTANALEDLAFHAKDALLVIDEFVPTGCSRDLHAKADRVLRAQGNLSGRLRMAPDLSVAAARHPRGIILSTGEDLPRGASLRARMLAVDVGPRDVDLAALTRCQSDAAAGLYAAAMAGYVRWLATRESPKREWRIWRVLEGMGDEVAALRERAVRSGMHPRTPDLIANLAAGLRHFLEFAADAGAVTKAEADRLWERGWAALLRAGRDQAGHQAAEDPATRFVDSIASALASGSAHLAGVDGPVPAEPARWGWRRVPGVPAHKAAAWAPGGVRIGWTDDAGVYLDPAASYKAAQDAAGKGEALSISPRTLHKRLGEAGRLIREGRRQEWIVRRTLEGAARRVLHLRPGILWSRLPG